MNEAIIGALELTLPDAQATMRVGATIAPKLVGGTVITLSGELGAGKTTLVRGLLRGLGWQGPVKSPTYALLEHYVISSLYLYHFDFYRLGDPFEWDNTGFADYFRPDSICLIEWPERVAGLLAHVDLALHLAQRLAPDSAPPGETRTLRAEAYSGEGSACLAALAANAP